MSREIISFLGIFLIRIEIISSQNIINVQDYSYLVRLQKSRNSTVQNIFIVISCNIIIYNRDAINYKKIAFMIRVKININLNLKNIIEKNFL